MPIIDVQVVQQAGEALADDAAVRLATAFGEALAAAPGHVWVRLRPLPARCYAENQSAEPVFPVFVQVTHASLPAEDALIHEARALAAAAAACLGRPLGHVHVEFAPAARGRIAFGGELLRHAS